MSKSRSSSSIFYRSSKRNWGERIRVRRRLWCCLPRPWSKESPRKSSTSAGWTKSRSRWCWITINSCSAVPLATSLDLILPLLVIIRCRVPSRMRRPSTSPKFRSGRLNSHWFGKSYVIRRFMTRRMTIWANTKRLTSETHLTRLTKCLTNRVVDKGTACLRKLVKFWPYRVAMVRLITRITSKSRIPWTKQP